MPLSLTQTLNQTLKQLPTTEAECQAIGGVWNENAVAPNTKCTVVCKPDLQVNRKLVMFGLAIVLISAIGIAYLVFKSNQKSKSESEELPEEVTEEEIREEQEEQEEPEE